MEQYKPLAIQEILQELPTRRLEALKKLFWEELNYELENSQLSYADWPSPIKELLYQPPTLWASAGEGKNFHITLCLLNSNRLNITAERQVVNQLLKEHPLGLYLFTNATQDHWHFINVLHEASDKAKRRRILRRISVSADDRLRTASERIARLDMQRIQNELLPVSAYTIQKAHEDAFDVEAVTEEFFNAYKGIFTELQADLEKQSGDKTWAHDFSLLFLNRLMFLYYVQRKRWLGNEADFMHGFWHTYRKAGRPQDSFVSEWLNILFFEAFNNRFQAGRADRAYLPQNFREALQAAPYLNGGLFKKHPLDDRLAGITVSDERMSAIFDFLDKYNFTISEDTPLDQEVAVDPEMIGKVYESLVNVSAEADQQADAGIFYTPRIEIDLMGRLALVDWLTNQTGKGHKNALYEWVFAFNPEDKRAADENITRLKLWPKLAELIKTVAVLDPACGSGSFLVGMLHILDDLTIRCNGHFGITEGAYERRKRIIAGCLYGVDVMDWAVHVAELRLWLQLVIESELGAQELHLRPLLPNLSFKVRQGDSLVQEYGGINFSLQRSGGKMPSSVKNRINRLKSEKLKFFDNDPTCKFASEELLKQEEKLVFREILSENKLELQRKLTEIETELQPRRNLLGEVQQPQMTLDLSHKAQEKEEIQNHITSLDATLNALQTAGHIPLIWDLSFVEIFQDEKAGFDIVIGNPPYVRQEKIRNPSQALEESTLESRRSYKAQLQQAAYAAWPRAFGYSAAKPAPAWKLNNRADYYIYFYLLCLKLVNPGGSFCFITSNSWLDVGYGRDLQQFLLEHARVKLIVDNQVKRSFAGADVNTVISLFSAASDAPTHPVELQQNLTRFILFKVPFENGLDAVLWEEIEECEGVKTTPEFRCLSKTQADLLRSGMDGESGRFAGDKWGGRYLRAPDIYWKILEKAGDKLVRLGDIAEVRFGIKTGANEFFYLDEEKIRQWGIEEEYLAPVIKSPRECKNILITPEEINTKLLICHNTKLELTGKNVLEYIKWGESNKYQNRPSCRNRKLWWDLGNQQKSYVFSSYMIDSLMNSFGILDGVFVDANFNVIAFHKRNFWTSLASMNNSIIQFFVNIFGRSNFGGGLIKLQTYEESDFLIIDPNYFSENRCKEIFLSGSRFELNSNDRKKLDEYIFEIINLSKEEIIQLYNDLDALIIRRKNKSRSK